MGLKVIGVKRQVLISSCVYLGQMLCGYSLSWTGPVIPKLRVLEQSPLPYLLTDTQLSLVATFVYFGCILGPYIMLWLSNIKGRKPCLIGGGFAIATGFAILAAATNLAMLYIGRMIVGVGGGSIAVMNLVYLGEIASTNIRGIFLTTVGLFHTVGTILLFAVGPYFTYGGTTYFGLALSLFFIFFVFWIPETPIFYALQGHDVAVIEVLQVLGRLEDKNKLLLMREEVKSNTRKEWKELITISSNRKALFRVVIINAVEQCCGVLAVFFYAADIFEMSGSSIHWNLSIIIIGCFQLTGNIITPFFIERNGRKLILEKSCVLCSISMFILGLYFYLDHIENSVVNHIKWLPLAALILFYIGYSAGLGTIPNTLTGEMFTINVRSKGSTVTMTMSWVLGFIVNTAFGALLKIVGGHTGFWFFSCICACGFLFTVFFIPETKGRTLLEIQEAL